MKLVEQSDGNYATLVKLAPGTEAAGTVDIDDIAPYPLTPTITLYTPGTTAYAKVTPSATLLDMIIRARTTSDDLYYAGIVTHKIGDATTIAATVPAASEAQDYALSIELIADHNTHTGSTTYHMTATAAASSTAATDEATLVAQANVSRTAMLAHYADTAAHGGRADATNLATVTATTIATNAATARTLLNALYPAHQAHLLVTDGGAYATVPAGSPLEWPCLGTVFVRASTSGNSFTVTEFTSA